MEFGIHLPQAGPAASAPAIAAVAKQAEDLGFADVWVPCYFVSPRSGWTSRTVTEPPSTLNSTRPSPS